MGKKLNVMLFHIVDEKATPSPLKNVTNVGLLYISTKYIYIQNYLK
jgi:hypothetical protein